MRQPGQFALLLFIASGAWSAPVETLFAQVVVPLETPRFDVVLNNVYLPVYPPLARQARIMGDVKILVGVRQDGSVASAEVVSGHPMLKQLPWKARRNRRSSAGSAKVRSPCLRSHIHSVSESTGETLTAAVL